MGDHDDDHDIMGLLPERLVESPTDPFMVYCYRCMIESATRRGLLRFSTFRLLPDSQAASGERGFKHDDHDDAHNRDHDDEHDHDDDHDDDDHDE